MPALHQHAESGFQRRSILCRFELHSIMNAGHHHPSVPIPNRHVRLGWRRSRLVTLLNIGFVSSPFYNCV